MTEVHIPGYDYGNPDLDQSPITAQALSQLLVSTAFSDADKVALRTAGDVLADQTDAVLDVWYGFVGSNPHLLAYFSTPDGAPISGYLERVRARFGQWILDTCNRTYDQDWLDYQNEIALRHTAAKKNLTDGAPSVTHIPLRHIIAFVAPLSLTMRPFLGARGHSAEEVDAMFSAWLKVVVLHAAVWAQPYAGEQW